MPAHVGGALAAVALAVAGCTAPEQGPDAVPPDLALEVTVVEPRGGGPGFRRYRTERYVLLADGSLHWERRDGPPAPWMPFYRRTLTTRQVGELWRLLRSERLDETASAGPPVNPTALEPHPQRTSVLVLVTGRGRRWAHAGALGDETGLARLVDQLGAWAWAAP